MYWLLTKIRKNVHIVVYMLKITFILLKYSKNGYDLFIKRYMDFDPYIFGAVVNDSYSYNKMIRLYK